MTQSRYYIDDTYRSEGVEPWDETSEYAPTPGYFRSPTTAPLYLVLDYFSYLSGKRWGVYEEEPPSCIHYIIEWRVTINKKIVLKDTEEDLVLALRAYWQRFLQDKQDKVLCRKTSPNGRVRADDTEIVVSVNDRI
ncbi:hypothetical protein NUU61_006977 [Penicillium alfredii]|uniref:Uncharacterized protein n=1 Tax=Penicillium alfredii TaxID=1506179 RepID=A0A9W9F232_9EURO|nr:uncharacterized protein NUU61_006977 [Penicillium alfredii]KAJ5092107.1 hypothetical protein NUU61_006977 [Penicillium alfredii]